MRSGSRLDIPPAGLTFGHNPPSEKKMVHPFMEPEEMTALVDVLRQEPEIMALVREDDASAVPFVFEALLEEEDKEAEANYENLLVCIVNGGQPGCLHRLAAFADSRGESEAFHKAVGHQVGQNPSIIVTLGMNRSDQVAAMVC